MLINKLQQFFKVEFPNCSTLLAINLFGLLELYLFVSGAIRLDVVLNVFLFIFVMFLFVVGPLAEKLSAFIMIKVVTVTVSIVLAVLLLWHQSWLPDIYDTFMLVKQYGLPSFDYIFSFFERIFTMPLLLSLLFLIAVSYSLRKIKMFSLVVLPALVIFMPVVTDILGDDSQADVLIQLPEIKVAEQMEPSEYLEEFYAKESERVILFGQPDTNALAFDLVVVHVCSLSWHDLKEIGMSKDDKFFQQFDYLFSNFNSAASYSGPAMHRLLLANCGQRSHRDLYDSNTPKACQLFESLASVGYQTWVTMDSNGDYEDFIGSVTANMPTDTTLISPEKLKVQAIFFDGKTRIYSDFDALKQWQDSVQNSNPERAALYYNSILLHAGVRWLGEKTSRGRDPHEQFKDVSLTLMDDVQAFINELQASKRNTVLLFVPEHGRALVGNSIQLADIRDIPLPSITKVPVGVKLMGPDYKASEQQEITKPTSYFALSWLISKFIKKSPFAENAIDPAKLAARIPKTEHVSENGERIILEIGGKTLYRGKDGKWLSLTKDQK